MNENKAGWKLDLRLHGEKLSWAWWTVNLCVYFGHHNDLQKTSACVINAEVSSGFMYYRPFFFSWSPTEAERVWMPVMLQWSSGLDVDGRLARDLSQTGTVQSSDHSGSASPLRREHLSAGQRGASWNQTKTRRVWVRCIRHIIEPLTCAWPNGLQLYSLMPLQFSQSTLQYLVRCILHTYK